MNLALRRNIFLWNVNCCEAFVVLNASCFGVMCVVILFFFLSGKDEGEMKGGQWNRLDKQG